MRLKVRFKQECFTCNVKVNDETSNFLFNIGGDIQTITRTDAEPYEGDYTVTPTFEAQTLPTARKYLTQDLAINAIAVSMVANPFGGNTVFIGG